jgi:hypothetical protein
MTLNSYPTTRNVSAKLWRNVAQKSHDLTSRFFECAPMPCSIQVGKQKRGVLGNNRAGFQGQAEMRIQVGTRALYSAI